MVRPKPTGQPYDNRLYAHTGERISRPIESQPPRYSFRSISSHRQDSQGKATQASPKNRCPRRSIRNRLLHFLHFPPCLSVITRPPSTGACLSSSAPNPPATPAAKNATTARVVTTALTRRCSSPVPWYFSITQATVLISMAPIHATCSFH